MKPPLLSSILFILSIRSAASFAVDLPPDWKNVQEVTVPKAGIVKFNLPVDTLDGAQAALEDLRILDPGGRELSYLIERPRQDQRVVARVKRFNVAVKDESSVVTVATGVAQPIDTVTLETPSRDFLKGTRLDGSTDEKTWKPLSQGEPIFCQSGSAHKFSLAVPPGVWPFLRITVDDKRSPPIPLTGAAVHLVAAEPAPAEPLDVAVVERNESLGQTCLTVRFPGRHVTLAELAVETSDPLFARRVNLSWRHYAENEIRESVLTGGTIYRVAVEGGSPAACLGFASDTLMPSREVTLTIQNDDSPPLQVSGVTARRRPVYVVFLAAQEGTHYLLTGHPRAAAPRYDLNALRGSLKNVVVTAPAISAITPNPSYRPSEVLSEITEQGASIDVAAWKCRKPVNLVRGGVQQLELDLDVMSQASDSFQDLRLVRNGNQVPYVVERTSISRSLAPVVSAANDPKRPRVSRWLLKLPAKPIPITSLTCTTEAPLFKREVRISEDVADERGVTYTSGLGSASWVRTPGQKTGKLIMPFSRSPGTDQVLLEMDNGDNPPLELKDIQLWYPLTRVLFKASTGSDLFLYYANHKVPFPEYDIALVAPQLLAAEKSAAVLAPEETLKKSGWEVTQLPGCSSWIFWGALALVIVVLLVVISRLLPPAQSPPKA